MDEVVLTIRGKKHSLWRAVDQDGNVLDILVQSRRNKNAAKRFFRKLRKRTATLPETELKGEVRCAKRPATSQLQRYIHLVSILHRSWDAQAIHTICRYSEL